MALVSIVIRDVGGKVDMTIESEPPFDLTDDGVLSDAQIIALNMMTTATEDAAAVDVKTSA